MDEVLPWSSIHFLLLPCQVPAFLLFSLKENCAFLYIDNEMYTFISYFPQYHVSKICSGVVAFISIWIVLLLQKDTWWKYHQSHAISLLHGYLRCLPLRFAVPWLSWYMTFCLYTNSAIIGCSVIFSRYNGMLSNGFRSIYSG